MHYASVLLGEKGGENSMRKRILGVVALMLASAVLVTLLFSGVAVGPAPELPVEFDVNVQNTPLPVEVTNPTGMPIATNCTSVYFADAGQATDYMLQTLSDYETTAIGDRTVVFTGGSISGSIVYSSENGTGGAPATGIVTVWTTSGPDPIRFALPLNSMFKVEHVNTIMVTAVISRPRLQGPSSFSFTVEASVFWFIEE